MHRWMAMFLFAAVVTGFMPRARAASIPFAVDPEFTVAAKAALLIEPESGTVLYAQNEHERFPPASVTKIMTMLLVMEALDSGRAKLNETITTSAFAAGMGGSQVFLKEGEAFSLREMLIAIAVVSANDASTAIAEHLYTTEDDFVRAMNTRARELGMKDTHFANAHGLPDPEHYMSAADIGIVARELIERHPGILEYTSIWTHTFRPGVSILRNTNELIREYQGADGLKTGYTNEAGWCLVGTAKRGDFRLISVVMGADNNDARLRETRRLLDYGFRQFEPVLIAKKGEELGRLTIRDAWPLRIKAVAPADLKAVAPKGKGRLFSIRLQAHPGLRAPLPKGTALGQVEVVYRGKVVGIQPAVAAERVGKAFFLVRAWRALVGWIKGLF